MSFRCQECNEAQPAGTPTNYKVVETRSKYYTNWLQVDERRRILKESEGTEIVKALSVCNKCK
jgi:hypothetical protein